MDTFLLFLSLFNFGYVLERFVLKESWFGHEVCGPSLGFARTTRTLELIVRCFFCRKDVKIGSRRHFTYAEHCGGAKHCRLVCLYWIKSGLPLRTRDGSLLNASARRRLTFQLKGVACPGF